MFIICLKLTEHLFEWEASAQVADFYERALFNHILSSQNPETGNVTYNLSLDMGGFKDFQDPFSFTCCVGSGMENHSKYGKNIFYHNDNELFVFQYIASELTWKEKGLILTQKTSFPEEQGSLFEFSCENLLSLPCRFVIRHGLKMELKLRLMEIGKGLPVNPAVLFQLTEPGKPEIK